MKGVFDTNILVDHLNGESRATAAISGSQPALISRITWMEVLVGANNPTDEASVRTFLGTFQIAELTPTVAEEAVRLRRNHVPKLRLPDAIIYATAKQEGCPLITRNTKDFPASAADVTVPYKI